MSCSGTIAATIPWSGSDPLPKCVIVKETATASWSGSSGNGSDGLGGTATGTSGDEDGVPGGSCTTVKYSVVNNPQNPLIRMDAPTAQASLPSPQAGLLAASANVSYKVEVFSVEIALSGTTRVDDYDNILIGQKCAASISCALVTLTNHQWTIPGEIYGGFSVNYDENGMIGSGGPVPLPGDLLTQPSPSWYWKKDLYATVECTATAIVSGTGEVIGQVTARKYVSVQVPTSDIRSYFGTVQLTRGGMLGLFGSPFPEPGMKAQAWAKTPDIFTGVGGTGSIQFTQKALDNASWTDSNNVTHYFNRNNIEGLDAGSYNDWGMYGSQRTADGSWAEGEFLEIADSPNLNLAALPNVVSASREFSAETWLMYIPPGMESAWVPLWKFTWSFTSSANGSVIPQNYLWDDWIPSVSGSCTHAGHFWLPEFPQWTHVLSQYGGYTPQ